MITNNEMERIKEMMERQNTPLHEDLVPHLKQTKSFPMLHHPLVVYAPYHEGLAYYANMQYENKTKAIIECLNKKNWNQYIWLHERPYRLEAFINIANELDPVEYWETLRHIWVDCEAPHINLDIWKSLFNSPKPNKDRLMSEEDWTTFNILPDVVRVYRGYENPKFRSGISHTTSMKVAAKFSQRFGKIGGVLVAEVPKKHIVAYTNQRGEDEIIITKRIKYKVL